MPGFVWSQFRFRRSRTGALALAILVAAVSFTLLTASARTSSLHVHGTLKSNFRPAYDILVRPPGSQTTLERSERLVRPNFLAGLYGGITFKQWHQIEHTRGVAVAAPVANIGYMMPFGALPIPIYLFRGDFETGPNVPRPLQSCYGFFPSDQPLQPTSPFPSLASQSSLSCFPDQLQIRNGTVISPNGSGIPETPTFVGTASSGHFPIYLTAIDPVQEAKLVGLDHTVVHGRYLRPNEGLAPYRPAGGSFAYKVVPLLASTRTYVDERLELTIERLRIPPGTDVPRLLATGSCSSSIRPCPKPLPPPASSRYRSARTFVENLRGLVIARRTVPIAAMYRDLLRTPPAPSWKPGIFTPDAYWTTSPTRYRRLGRDKLAPLRVQNPASVWTSNFSNFYEPPYDNLDPQFRRLHERVSTNVVGGGTALFNPLRIVGEFDPAKLPSFSPLSKVPLETYSPPELLPGNQAARQALHDRALLPNQNLAGYIQQPPLFLTTMQGLKRFLDPKIWQTPNGASAIPPVQRRAPISAIRIKVAGVSGPDPLSLERVRLTAQRIHDETGLVVDITAGSSPHPVLISLAKGSFGRPPLLLQEGWSKKGVTVSFLFALDRKDLALFALILVICAFFLGNGALASVRARRAEIGTLLTLGWSRAAIFSVVLAELAVIGVAAGALGAGVAALLAATLAPHVSLASTLLVLPIAVLLALSAGALPAWLAARGTPLDALTPPVAIRRRAWPVRRLATLALANLTRLPARTLLGAGGLALGVAALSVLLGIERAFQGTLVGTVLGNAISLQIRGADFAAVGLTIALAALSVADVVYLDLRERAAEIVTLKTMGWAPSHIRATVLLEGLALGLLGGLAGGLLGLAIGTAVLGVPFTSLALTCLIAAGGGIFAAGLASSLPLSQLGRLAAPAVLAAE